MVRARNIDLTFLPGVFWALMFVLVYRRLRTNSELLAVTKSLRGSGSLYQRDY